MDFAELERRLRQHAGIDVQAEYQQFQRLTGARSAERFLMYLRDRGLVSGALLLELHGNERARVAQLQGVHGGSTLSFERADDTEREPPTAEASTQLLSRATPGEGEPEIAEEPGAPGQGTSYDMLGLVARGAMGDVFVARDRVLLRKVALKRLSPALARRPNTAARFFNEVQVTAQLDHPSVVPIHALELGSDGLPGYTMKLIQGRTLTELLEEARQHAADGDRRAESRRLTGRLEAFLKVCDAMSYAHSKGVLHRDLKPDNIMLGDYSEVYVMDWGICCLLDEGGVAVAPTRETGEIPASPERASRSSWEQERSSVVAREWDSAVGQEWDSAAWQEGNMAAPRPLHTGTSSSGRYTQHGAIVGTPAYMSPEQTQPSGPALDTRSDLYALGLILFELVALRSALAGGGAEATLLRAAHGDKHPLVHHNPRFRIARELRAIIDKATARRREDRYPSVDAFARDIRAFMRGDAVSARPDTPPQVLLRWLGRHKLVTLLVTAVLLLASAGATIGVLVQKEAALREARHHEERVLSFLLAVSRHSHAIDSHFATFEKGLARLAGRVHGALEQPPGAEQRIYLSQDFASLDRAPTDLALIARYSSPISLDHPVFKLAPDVSDTAVENDLQRLSRLTSAIQDFMLETAGVDISGLTRAGRRQRIQKGVPVIRTFITLENGVYLSYPGQGGHPPEFDGRLRPNYRLVAHRRGIAWGNPYPDPYGLGLILSAATSVYDGHGQFVGVTGLDMTFDWLIENLLALPNAPYMEGSYLVNRDREVVIQADRNSAGTSAVQGGGTGRDLHGNRTIELASLPFPEVRRALVERRAGHVAFRHEGRDRIAAFYPVDTVGWTYVVVADRARLLAAVAPAIETAGPKQ